MSKEQKRKKKLRLDLKRSSIMVAALASVAVGGVAHAAEEVDASTQPSTTTSATESKPNKEVAPEKLSSKVDTSVKPTEKTDEEESKESKVSDTVKPKEVPSTGSLSESSDKSSKLEEVKPSTGTVSTNNPTTETVTSTVQSVKPVSNMENKPAENNSVEVPVTEGVADKPKGSGSEEVTTSTPERNSEKPKKEGARVSSNPDESFSEKPKEGVPVEGYDTNSVPTSNSDKQKEDKPLEGGLGAVKPKEDSPSLSVNAKTLSNTEGKSSEGAGDTSNPSSSAVGTEGTYKPSGSKEESSTASSFESSATDKEEGGSEGSKPDEGRPEKPTLEGAVTKPKESEFSDSGELQNETLPRLLFSNNKNISKQGNTYNITSDVPQEVDVKVPAKLKMSNPRIIQTFDTGTVRELTGLNTTLYPVASKVELHYTDERGLEQVVPLGRIIDKSITDITAVGTDRELDLTVHTLIPGDRLPSVLEFIAEDGKTTLMGYLRDNSYHLNSSELPEGNYVFHISEKETTSYGRKFTSKSFHMKGKEIVKPVEPQPVPLPNPVPTPVPEVPSVPSVPETPSVTPEPAKPSLPSVDVPVAPSVEVKPLTPTMPAEKPSVEQPSVEKPKTDTTVKPVEKPSEGTPKPVSPTVVPTVSDHSVSPITPTPSPVPNLVEQPNSVKPQGTPSTDVSNVDATIITPTKPVETNNTNGNTNTNSSNINIGGVSNQANYTENPNRLTVDVNSGSVREVKATVSSQEGTTELQGRVVNGSFVADKLPEKDGVYTVKVKVTDDKGQVSEKTITYAVNKNGSTYDWLSKGVNGSYYQRLTEDLKLSEHSTTQLDTSKTKFTFTLDGKVITVDASQVQVNEKKEDDGSYTYTYTFNKGAFKENGVWSISVATVDVDGHASSSNASVQLQFVLDNIVPELKIEGIANNNQYNSAKHQFRVLVKDNIGLAKVLVKINGKVYEFTKDELLKGEKVLDLVHSSKPYTIEVEVTDLAGNTTNQTVEGITVSATDIQALLESDNVKLALAIFGTAAFGGLLTWWALAIRNRKRKEEELERYRLGAHIVTEAEGLVSSNGSGSVEHTDLQGGSPVAEGVGFVAAEVLGSVKDTGSITTPVSIPSSEGETTETLPLDGEIASVTEVLDYDEVEEVTTILSEGEEAVAEKTTILEEVEEGSTEVLDSKEHTTVLEDEDLTEPTEVLDSEEASTEVLEPEVSTEVLDSEEHTTVLEEEISEPTEVLDSEEKTTVLDIEDEELAEKTTILEEIDEDTEVLD